MDSPTQKRPRSECEAESNDKDRISCLPEQVIGRILSRLTSREARATCVLSRRWRHLCTSLLTDLEFYWLDILHEMADNPKSTEKERARYAEWVDSIVRRQSGGDHAVRRFAIRFDLNVSYKSQIDRWIKFALAKQVKVLELIFEPTSEKDLGSRCPPSRPYVFGHEILTNADVGCSRRASGLGNYGSSPSFSWHVGWRYLEHLSLTRVRVEGEVIEQLLTACPVLEKLVLEFASCLKRFRVSGQSLKLKYLCIRQCENLKRFVIQDTNLVSFTFHGYFFISEKRIPFYLDNLPQLSEVSIEGAGLEDVRNILSRLSSLSRLRILKLELSAAILSEFVLLLRELPILTSVEQLELRFRGRRDSRILPLAAVVKACPSLRRFVLELMEPMDWSLRGREPRIVVGTPHRHLKVVEFYNYYGQPCDLELVNYLIENVITLEKLAVHPCEEAHSSNGSKKEKKPRERALKQLQGNVPSRIELMID